MSEVYNLEAKISLDSTEYTNGLHDASEKTDSFASKIGSGFANTVKVATATIAAMGAAAATLGKSLYSAVSETAEYGDNVDKMSQKIGISTGAYQEWSYVMDLCGTNVDNLQTGMKTLSSVITDAGNGADSAAGKLAAVGLSMDDLAGLTQEQQLQKVVEALQGMGEGSARTAAATDLLGRSATDMAALLNLSADEMNALKQEANDYGMVMSEKAVKQSAAFKDSLTKLSGTFTGVKNSMMGDFLPGITQIVNGFSDLLIGADGADEAIQNGVNNVVEQIQRMVPKITNILNTVLPTIIKALPGIMKSLASAIGGMIPELLPAIGEAILGIFNALAEMSGDFVPGLIELIISLAEGFISAIPQVIDSIWTIVSNIFTALAGMDWVTIGTQLMEALQSAISEVANMLFGSDHSILDAIFEGIINGISVLADMALKIVTGLVGYLTQENVLGNLISGAMAILTKIIDVIVENLPLLLDTATQIITSLLTYLTQEDVLGQLLDGALQIIMSIVTFLCDPEVISNLVDAALTIITSLVDFMINNLDEILTAIGTFIVELFTRITSSENLEKLWDFALKILETLVAFMGQVIWEIVKPFTVFAKQLYDVLTGNTDINTALEEIGKSWGESIIGKLFDGIISGLAWLGDLTGMKVNSQTFQAFKDNWAKSSSTGDFNFQDVFDATMMDAQDIYLYGEKKKNNFLDNKEAVNNYNVYVEGKLAETADQAYQEALEAAKWSGITGAWSTVPTSAREAMAKG